MLEENGVETHFVKELSDRETLVRAVRIVPLEIIVRNVAAGSFSKRYGVEEGRELKCPTLEFSLKDDALNDPLINDSHILALGVATEEELTAIRDLALKVNALLKDYFLKRGVKLIDFKIEAGRYDGRILLADEISPDTCRFWDAKTNSKLDKDRFRRDLGGVEEAYQEMFKRVTA
ncbi:MAG: phosphoribosylaminoimidazolesuccinocarboxamide synthase, partial [Fretibacterium sp.]|nr:phosphoribosylaminoimidazolesuccinocarboxamide synthase [Fretibacterium sp.]